MARTIQAGTLKERALESGAVASMPHRPGAGAGSLDPRA